MKEIQVTIQGKTPLLLHRFTDAAQQSASSGSRSAISNDSDTPSDQAKAALYFSNDGKKPVIPQPMLMGTIMGGGSFHRIGKSKVTTQKSSMIPAALAMTDEYVPIESKAGWKVDSRPVRIPSTGGRILRHRPMFDDWKLSFKIQLDESIITEKLMRQIIEDAGNRVGLGDFRPSCRGPYGRFGIVAWKASNGKA